MSLDCKELTRKIECLEEFINKLQSEVRVEDTVTSIKRHVPAPTVVEHEPIPVQTVRTTPVPVQEVSTVREIPVQRVTGAIKINPTQEYTQPTPAPQPPAVRPKTLLPFTRYEPPTGPAPEPPQGGAAAAVAIPMINEAEEEVERVVAIQETPVWQAPALSQVQQQAPPAISIRDFVRPDIPVLDFPLPPSTTTIEEIPLAPAPVLTILPVSAQAPTPSPSPNLTMIPEPPAIFDYMRMAVANIGASFPVLDQDTRTNLGLLVMATGPPLDMIRPIDYETRFVMLKRILYQSYKIVALSLIRAIDQGYAGQEQLGQLQIYMQRVNEGGEHRMPMYLIEYSPPPVYTAPPIPSLMITEQADIPMSSTMIEELPSFVPQQPTYRPPLAIAPPPPSTTIFLPPPPPIPRTQVVPYSAPVSMLDTNMAEAVMVTTNDGREIAVGMQNFTAMLEEITPQEANELLDRSRPIEIIGPEISNALVPFGSAPQQQQQQQQPPVDWLNPRSAAFALQLPVFGNVGFGQTVNTAMVPYTAGSEEEEMAEAPQSNLSIEYHPVSTGGHQQVIIEEYDDSAVPSIYDEIVQATSDEEEAPRTNALGQLLLGYEHRPALAVENALVPYVSQTTVPVESSVVVYNPVPPTPSILPVVSSKPKRSIGQTAQYSQRVSKVDKTSFSRHKRGRSMSDTTMNEPLRAAKSPSEISAEIERAKQDVADVILINQSTERKSRQRVQNEVAQTLYGGTGPGSRAGQSNILPTTSSSVDEPNMPFPTQVVDIVLTAQKDPGYFVKEGVARRDLLKQIGLETTIQPLDSNIIVWEQYVKAMAASLPADTHYWGTKSIKEKHITNMNRLMSTLGGWKNRGDVPDPVLQSRINNIISDIGASGNVFGRYLFT